MNVLVLDYLEVYLRAEATKLQEYSLKYFKAQFMSFSKPHQLWTTCGSNPFEIQIAVIQARILSGRYVTDKLARHWTENKSGMLSHIPCTQKMQTFSVV